MWSRVAEDLSTLADIDASGDIDFNEFIAVMFNADALSPEDLHAHLHNVFSDIAGSERGISADELAQAFHGGTHTHRELIDTLFREMDTDSSGSVTLQQFEEFLASL